MVISYLQCLTQSLHIATDISRIVYYESKQINHEFWKLNSDTEMGPVKSPWANRPRKKV